MLFPGRKRGGDASVRVEVIQTTRDLIEIIAIILAGTWAIYTFVYENRIKPSEAPPEITMSAQLIPGTAHNGLIPVRILMHGKNVGTVTAHFLGYSVTLLGSRVAPAAKMQPALEPVKGIDTLAAFYKTGPAVPLFRLAYLTHATDPSISTDMLLNPGEEQQNEYLTYVPAHRFDRLALHLVMSFTKSTRFPIPAKLSFGPSGIPRFTFDPASDAEIDQFNYTVTAADIAGR